MAFDQSPIAGLTLSPDMGELFVAWTSTAPADAVYQVYAGGRLAWSGRGRSCRIPLPTEPGPIIVGRVGPHEGRADYSATIPAVAGPRRARITWEGGTYLAGDIHEFLVYGEASPGGGVNYAAPLGRVLAYDKDPPLDGFGLGGFGSGGFGYAAGSYSWLSPPLAGGTWHFAVRAADRAGNESTAATASVTVAAPPGPPAPDAAGRRLTYTYDAATKVVTLHWLASP
jgi:hypothetical protein